MPRLKPLTVTDDERSKLQAWGRRARTAPRLALRSRIVLAAPDVRSHTAIGPDLRVTLPTVGTWRPRFLDKRRDGLTDEPRPGPPRTVTDAHVEDVATRTPETQPANATHGSTRGMAPATGRSQTAISRIWRAFGLQPHRADTSPLPTDPYFVEKVRDVVGLYLRPPGKAIVLSVDEKSGTPAVDRTPPVLPRTPGPAERSTPADVRNGTTSRFAAGDVATGKVLGRGHRRHRHPEFVRFRDEIPAAAPAADGVTVHRVVDNYPTHKTPAVKRWRARHPRFVVHFTPTSASGINHVERFFAEIPETGIRPGVFPTVTALGHAIEPHLAEHNAHPKPFTWTATADLILRKVEGVCKRTRNSGH